LPSNELATSVKQPWSSKRPAVSALLQEAASVESPGGVPVPTHWRERNRRKHRASHADKVLEEFQPHLLKQHEGHFVKYDNFSTAVEDFSHLVNQKRLQKGAGFAWKVNSLTKNEVRTDLQDRVVALEQDQEGRNTLKKRTRILWTLA
jgi:hypothetical protein